jgi:hypothetical protein
MYHQQQQQQRSVQPNSTSLLHVYDNYKNSYTQCPLCGSEARRLIGLPFLTCDNRHQFYDCPTCLDTRVSEVKENVYYCAQLHPYHLCSIHHIPVVGPANFRTDRCTCPREVRPILRQAAVPNWDSPFL